MRMELSLAEIAERVGARVVGDPSIQIRRVNGIREAGPGEITFLAHPKYEAWLDSTRAAAVIRSESLKDCARPGLIGADPYLLFMQVAQLFHRAPTIPVGVHATAIVDPEAELEAEVAIGPHAVIEAGARIGRGSIVGAGCYVGAGSSLGARCLLYPNVVIREACQIGDDVIVHPGAVIGADGFGYAFDGERHRKIPQLGIVVIENDVEIGAGATIDRATLHETRIRRGVRIDNLVHIAHNVDIGEHSLLCAQVGIAGSTRIGHHVVFGGQAGAAGHIEIGDGARIGGQGGVTKSIPAGGVYSGYPAYPHLRAQRIYAAQRQLPELLRAHRQLERRVLELEAKLQVAEREASDVSPPTGPA